MKTYGYLQQSTCSLVLRLDQVLQELLVILGPLADGKLCDLQRCGITLQERALSITK